MVWLLARLAYFLSLWVGVAAATFVLFHVVPSDPARTMLGANASEEQVAVVRHNLGLDQPTAIQFTSYASRALALDFGLSFVDQRPVAAEVGKRIALSAALAGVATAIIAAYLVLTAAIASGRKWAWLGELTDFFCVSLPNLFAGVVVALATIAYYPYTRFSGALVALEDWLYLLPPALVLALYPMGILGRIMRSQIRVIRESQHVRAARALGLSERTILFRYVLRNALIPLLSAFGNQLPLLLTSTFIVELVFSVPGIGALLLRSVLERDLPMLEGIVIATSVFVLGTSLVLEAIYPLADPRIRGRNER